MIVEYILDQKPDQIGEVEDFTRDTGLLYPVGTADHLDENGLPLVGSEVHPGMLLICKIGASKTYDRNKLPYDLERWNTEESDLIKRYSHMFYDASFYVPEGVYGTVKEAFFKPHGKYQRAVVRIETRDKP